MQACRICFITDVKMVILGESQEKEFLENSFSSYGVSEWLIEDYSVCYECKALLSKSCNFIHKAIRAHQALLVYQDQKMIDTDMWTTIRNEWGLNSTLSYHVVEIDFILNDTLGGLLCADEIENKYNKKTLNDLNYSNVCNNNDENNVTPNHIMPDVKSEIDKYKNESIPLKNIEDGHISNDVITAITISDGAISDIESNKPCNKENESKFIEPHKDKNTLKYKKKLRINTLISNEQRKKGNRKHYTEVYVMNNSSSENEEPEAKSQINPENIISGKRKRVINNFSESECSNINDNKRQGNTSTVTKKKRKYKKKEDEDFRLDNVSPESDSESSEYSYDDNGKRLKKPPREYPRQCDHCEYEIESGNNHYKHYQIHHSHELYPYLRTKNVYVCQHCGKYMPTSLKLARHEATHGEKTIPCSVCDKKFFHSTHVRKHFRRVHGEIKYFCEFCNKGFKSKSDLKLHIRIHTGEKPFKCHICPAAFAHSGNRNLHLRKGHHKLPNDANTESEEDYVRPAKRTRKTRAGEKAKVQKKVCKKRTRKH